MIPKRNLRKQILQEKNHVEENISVDKLGEKTKTLDKKYNLRGVKLNDENIGKVVNCNSQNNVKILPKKTVKNFTTGKPVKGKENNIKPKGQRQVVKINNFTKTKTSSLQNLIKLKDENKNVLKEKNISGVGIALTVEKKSGIGKNVFKYSKENVTVKGTDVQCGKVIKEVVKIPAWKKSFMKRKSNRVAKKSFFDVYDMSQDEDMAFEEKHQNKIKVRNNVKKLVNKKKYPSVQNKNVKSKGKCSNTSKPKHNELVKCNTNQHQLNAVNSQPIKMKEKVFLQPQTKPTNTHVTDIVNEIDQNSIFTESPETDPIDVPEPRNSDDLPVELSYQEEKKSFLLNLVNDLEKSLLLPRMTSTPDSTLLVNIENKPIQNNILLSNNLSCIAPNNKNCCNVVIDTPDPFPVKKRKHIENAEITLFESPERKKKKPSKFKSPQKAVQMNLFDNFSSPAPAQQNLNNLEDSVLKPKKAYHTPDHFKIHLVRTKRKSEVPRKENFKSKDELLMEKMAQHFEEISSTELCVE